MSFNGLLVSSDWKHHAVCYNVTKVLLSMSNVKIQRILLVDDEPDVTELLKYKLEQEGYRCKAINDPLEFVASSLSVASAMVAPTGIELKSNCTSARCKSPV